MSAQKDETESFEIAVDPNVVDDSDYSSSFLTGDSQSITSSVVDYVFENGRRYHRYSEGKYMLPNDETEQDRLDIAYHAHLVLLEGKPFTAPIEPNPQRILDLGTGTGIWALDVAQLHPSAIVLGIDLSPIQPAWVWPNCKFEIDDMEQPWTWPVNHFDFIHARNIAQSIRDWSKLAGQMYTHSRPGGFVELSEIEGDVHSDDNSIPPDSYLRKAFDLFQTGIVKLGIPYIKGSDLRAALEGAGFADVTVRTIKQPIAPWAAEKRLKEVGKYLLAASESGYEAYLLAVFTRGLGMSVEDATLICKSALADQKKPQVHAYQLVWQVHGRKPN